MSLVLLGSTSGSVTLQEPAVAGSTTINLPATSGTMAVLPTATSVLPEASGGTGTTTGYYGFKNRLINGSMVIDQRNAGASYLPTNAIVVYGADRWLTYSGGAGITAQRISNSGLTGFPYAFRQTGASGNTYASFVQRIESANCLDLSGQQVTLSFYAATSNSSNIRVGLEYAGSSDNFNSPTVIQQQTIATTSTLTRYSFTFNALPSNVTNGIQLDIEAASGIGVGVTFTITGVQLEKGSTATSFDYRPYGTELQLCQRYLPAFNLVGADVVALVTYATSTLGYVAIPFSVPTRTQATGASITNPTNFTAFSNANITPSAMTFSAASVNSGQINLTVSGATIGQSALLRATGTAQILFTGCEL